MLANLKVIILRNRWQFQVAKNRYMWHGCQQLHVTLAQLKGLAVRLGLREQVCAHAHSTLNHNSNTLTRSNLKTKQMQWDFYLKFVLDRIFFFIFASKKFLK
jgi:hypothetical protein